MFTKKNSAEAMDGRDGSCRKDRKDPYPFRSMLRVDSRSNTISHLGGRFFGECDGNDAKRIHSTFAQFEVYLDKLPGLARAGTRQHNGVSLKNHKACKASGSRTRSNLDSRRDLAPDG